MVILDMRRPQRKERPPAYSDGDWHRNRGPEEDGVYQALDSYSDGGLMAPGVLGGEVLVAGWGDSSCYHGTAPSS